MSTRARIKFVPYSNGIRPAGEYAIKSAPIFGAGTIFDTSVTLDPMVFGEVSKLSESNAGTYYHPVQHETISANIGGGIPGWNPGPEPYIHLVGTRPLSAGVRGLYQTDIPTRMAAAAGVAAFPEIRFRPDFKKVGWLNRFDGTSQKISTFRPSLSTGFSLVNFIIQWRDIEHVYKRYLQPAPKGSKRTETTNAMKKLIIIAKKDPGSKASRLASQWLAFQYGTKQLFADIFTVMRIIATWKKNADKYLAGINRPHYISDTVRYIPRSESVIATVPYRPSPFVDDSEVFLRLYEGFFTLSRATLVYQYSVPKLPGFIARLTQLLDAFGVVPDPSIVWDAIPFSFVLDWFLNVGEWLHRQRIDWNEAKFTFREFGVSAKLAYARTVYLEHDIVQGGYLVPPQMVMSVGTEEYVRELRKLEDVYTPAVTNKEQWHLTRILNATALSVSRVARAPTTVYWGGKRAVWSTGKGGFAI